MIVALGLSRDCMIARAEACMAATGKLIGGMGGALDALDGFAGSAADAVQALIDAVRNLHRVHSCSSDLSHSLWPDF